jgi:HK97 family phage prohead protease
MDAAKKKGLLLRISERVLNTPLLITRDKLDAILAVLGPRIGLDAQAIPAGFEAVEKRDIYSVTDDGIAVLDIQGSLANRGFGALDVMSGMTSYEELRGLLSQAAEDKAIKGVVLRVASPGGEVGGIPDLANFIDGITKTKPVWTAVDDYAYSAAYWIAAATNRIYVSSTGGVGSVGVIAQHVDESEYEKREGFKVTTIFSGARKNDLSPHEPISGDAMARLRKRVDDVYGMFVSSVAHFRGMAKTAVRSTEADTFYGQDAIDMGFADRLGTFDAALSDMRSMLARNTRDDLPAVITESKSEQRGPVRAEEVRQYGMTGLTVETGDEPRITGHVAVFNQWSADLGPFIEKIEPGAFSKTIKEGDIHLYWNHDGTFVLGRNKSGTLTLTEDETGLLIENLPPNTQMVRDLVLEPMRRGDVDKGSFAFMPVRQEWGRLDGELTRTLHEVRLFHTAILPKGAYPQTSVGLRAFSDGIDLLALASIEAKCRLEIPLSEDERGKLTTIIAALQAMGIVTPGLAAHLTTGAGTPSLNRTPTEQLSLLMHRAQWTQTAMRI